MMLLVIWLSSTLSLTTALYDGEVSVYELLYGDLTNLEKSFALPFNLSVSPDPNVTEPNPVKRRPLGELLAKLEKDNQILESSEHRFDVQDFNTITNDLKQLTRRYYKEGKRYYYDEDDYYSKGIHERKKKMMLLMANIQFLIHTRYKIVIAIRLRNVVKRDKRYKLGYLFARLRRLLTAQRKMAASSEANRLSYIHHNLYAMMRLYEKVARLDIDMRDTCALIKSVFGERANVDKVY